MGRFFRWKQRDTLWHCQAEVWIVEIPTIVHLDIWELQAPRMSRWKTWKLLNGSTSLNHPFSSAHLYSMLHTCCLLHWFFRSGLFKPNQLSTKQLAQGVAETFWLSIKHSLRYQIDFFKGTERQLGFPSWHLLSSSKKSGAGKGLESQVS